MSRHLGLIIGVNQYQDSAFRTLQFAENDSRALAQWLVNEKGGKWSPPNTQVVQGQHATRELIESLITQMCLHMAESGDIVFIYFAGHAFIDERTGEGYLAFSNTRYQDPSTGLHLSSMIQPIITSSRAAQTLCILDCFQNGQLWSMRRTSPYDSQPLLGSALNILQQQQNRLFLCSCRGNEFFTEAGERNLGFFAHRMLLGLCGPASDPAGNITLPNLYNYLTNASGPQQRPQLFGQQQQPLILIGELPPAVGTLQPLPATPFSTVPVPRPSNMSASSNFLQGAPSSAQESRYAATAQLSPRPQEPSTSGQLLTLTEPQQQQYQQTLAQAQQYLQAQNYPAAMSVVTQLLQFMPTDTAALTLKGQILGNMGHFQEALSTTEQLLRIEPNNALIWSMRAVSLSNTGQYQAALASIERSLELDSNNPETYSIKTSIMGQLAVARTTGSQQRPTMSSARDLPKRGNPTSFFIAAGIYLAGLVAGLAGITLLVVSPELPFLLGLGLASMSLALLSVNAARGTFLHGIAHIVLALLLSLTTAGILGAAYKFGYAYFIRVIQATPQLIIPILFSVGWLAIAAIIPLLLAIGGFISGMIASRRK